jgi:23S rRNA (uracil1939-C5)-methyltransferase
MDPPRTGAKELARALARRPVPRILYISCDPPTLKRDLAVLENAYVIRTVETFELFPQTSHVETIVVLERRRRKERP